MPYNQVKQTNNNLVTYGDFINLVLSSLIIQVSLVQKVFDLLNAIEIEGHPLVKIYQINELDDNENNVYQNGTPNGKVIYLCKRKTFGLQVVIFLLNLVGGIISKSILVVLVNIDDSSADLGTLSDYSSSVNTTDPFTITLNEDIIDGTEIEFIISIWDDNYPEKIDSRTTL